jgi:hypothetical protein
MRIEPERVQALRLHLLAERALRAVEADGPFVDARDGQRQAADLGQDGDQVEVGGHDDLARPQHLDFFIERLTPGFRDIFGGREFAGGHVDQRRAEALDDHRL